MSTLYLSIYDPIWGNTPHWALKLHAINDSTQQQQTITTYYFQIFGEHKTFEFDETIGKDPVIAQHREDIKIWSGLSVPDVARVRKVAREMFIDNSTVMWNCQDWCIDVIRELEEELVIGVDDDGDEEDREECLKLKDDLVEKMGPDL